MPSSNLDFSIYYKEYPNPKNAVFHTMRPSLVENLTSESWILWTTMSPFNWSGGNDVYPWVFDTAMECLLWIRWVGIPTIGKVPFEEVEKQHFDNPSLQRLVDKVDSAPDGTDAESLLMDILTELGEIEVKQRLEFVRAESIHEFISRAVTAEELALAFQDEHVAFESGTWNLSDAHWKLLSEYWREEQWLLDNTKPGILFFEIYQRSMNAVCTDQFSLEQVEQRHGAILNGELDAIPLDPSHFLDARLRKDATFNWLIVENERADAYIPEKEWPWWVRRFKEYIDAIGSFNPSFTPEAVIPYDDTFIIDDNYLLGETLYPDGPENWIIWAVWSGERFAPAGGYPLVFRNVTSCLIWIRWGLIPAVVYLYGEKKIIKDRVLFHIAREIDTSPEGTASEALVRKLIPELRKNTHTLIGKIETIHDFLSSLVNLEEMRLALGDESITYENGRWQLKDEHWMDFESWWEPGDPDFSVLFKKYQSRVNAVYLRTFLPYWIRLDCLEDTLMKANEAIQKGELDAIPLDSELFLEDRKRESDLDDWLIVMNEKADAFRDALKSS